MQLNQPHRVVRAFSFALALALPVAATAPALGQAELLGEHSAWSAYTIQDDTGRICFTMSAPTATAPEGAAAGEAHLYITHRVAENIRSEVNLVSGYVFAPESLATATVGSQSFTLVTAGEGAWLADPAQTTSLLGAMRAGATIGITGTSDAGAQVTQTFSLAGVTAATDRIDQTC